MSEDQPFNFGDVDPDYVDATPFAAKWNLDGIQKSEMSLRAPVRIGPKEGDRFFLNLGDGKILEHIVEDVAYDRHGGFTFTPRPVTPEDGPRTREQRGLVRAMQRSWRRRNIRRWLRWIPGVADD
jgi:hypothetical protein